LYTIQAERFGSFLSSCLCACIHGGGEAIFFLLMPPYFAAITPSQAEAQASLTGQQSRRGSSLTLLGPFLGLAANDCMHFTQPSMVLL